jgi:hypothetical protein
MLPSVMYTMGSACLPASVYAEVRRLNDCARVLMSIPLVLASLQYTKAADITAYETSI